MKFKDSIFYKVFSAVLGFYAAFAVLALGILFVYFLLSFIRVL